MILTVPLLGGPGECPLEIWRAYGAGLYGSKAMQLRDYAHADQRVVEFYQEQHTKQTVAFVQDKRRQFFPLRHRAMTMWEAVLLLQELQDDSDPDMDRPQIVHAVQTAERIRAVVATGVLPGWMIVTGLLHDVGKGVLLSLGEPQYAVVGDTFIVGCQWAPQVVYHELFADNPDTRVPLYQTPFGRYQSSCESGLDGVLMSWGHDEYLYEVVRQYFYSTKSAHPLPEEALAIFRYHSFYAAHTHGAYAHLMTAHDRAMLEWVRAFSQFDLYSKSEAPRPKGGASSGRWAPQTTPCSETPCPSSEEDISLGGISPKPPKTNPIESHPAPRADDSGCIVSPLPLLLGLPPFGQNTHLPRTLVSFAPV